MLSERRTRPSSAASLAQRLLGAALLACDDPVKDAAVAALGPELPGVAAGPLHRPGQPCLVCHDGATARAFALAGTVFWTAESDLAAPGTEVRAIDSAGHTFTALTNCAGNFMVRPEELEPRYPLWVLLRRGSLEIALESPVRGDGSCAGCHRPEPGPESAGRVYVHAIAPATGPGDCP